MGTDLVPQTDRTLWVLFALDNDPLRARQALVHRVAHRSSYPGATGPRSSFLESLVVHGPFSLSRALSVCKQLRHPATTRSGKTADSPDAGSSTGCPTSTFLTATCDCSTHA